MINGSDAIHPKKLSVEAEVAHFNIGRISQVKLELPKIYLQCNSAQVMIHFLSDSLFRVKLNPDGSVLEKTTDAIDKKDWEKIDIDVSEDSNQYVFKTNQIGDKSG